MTNQPNQPNQLHQLFPRAAAVLLALALAACPMLVRAEPAGSEPLVSREQELARQFEELEKTFLRLADLLAASDPRRSSVLRSA